MLFFNGVHSTFRVKSSGDAIMFVKLYSFRTLKLLGKVCETEVPSV